MLDVLWSLGAFVVTLGILVTFHEFGHYWVARRCGVKVLTFSVGFGKAFWQRTGRDGTVYQLSVIPLGGYVRMLDTRVDEVSPALYPQSFNAQSVGKRMAIVAAGPIANFILAIAVLWGMLMLGVPSVKPVVGSVAPASIAAQAQLPQDAEIVAINGRSTRDWQAVNMALVGAIGDEQATLSLMQNGRQQDYRLDLRGWNFDSQTQTTFQTLGIQPFQPHATREIGFIAPNSPADSAGLAVDDKILGMNGTLMGEWSQIREFIAAEPGETVAVMVERNGETITLNVTLGQRERVEGDGELIGFLGVETKALPYPEEYRFINQFGPLESFTEGVSRTWELMVLSVKMIGKLFTGDVSVTQLSGPVSIAEGAGATASYGLVYFLGFLALISVNLGIINLLPLPVLDGGHLVFFVIEWIKGSPVSERVQDVSYRIGGALIFALMLVAISNDILRLTL